MKKHSKNKITINVMNRMSRIDLTVRKNYIEMIRVRTPGHQTTAEICLPEKVLESFETAEQEYRADETARTKSREHEDAHSNVDRGELRISRSMHERP